MNTDGGGIRGLTTMANPHGNGDSILLLWASNGRTSSGQIKRLDPDRAYPARAQAPECDAAPPARCCQLLA